jgi:hypothetical protein
MATICSLHPGLGGGLDRLADLRHQFTHRLESFGRVHLSVSLSLAGLFVPLSIYTLNWVRMRQLSGKLFYFAGVCMRMLLPGNVSMRHTGMI